MNPQELLYRHSSNGGTTWGTEETISNSGSEPDIATSGNIVRVLWFDDGDLLRSQKEVGGSWETPITLVDAADQPTGSKPCKHIIDIGEHIAYSAEVNGIRDIYYNGTGNLLSLFPGQDWNVECPFCNVNNTQGVIEGIHPRSGSFVYGDRELSLPIINGELTFDYSYISAAIDVYTTTMGYGWTHKYDMQLHFTSTVSTHTVILQAPGGSRFPYLGNGDGSYTRYPGVTAEMVRVDGASPNDTRYIITTFNQYVFTFDANGKFIEAKDPAGNIQTLTYDAGLLDKVQQGSRYLEFTYDANDRVKTVKDNFNRTISLNYTGNNLTSITAPLNRTTTFNYKTSTNLLEEIVDASGRTVKEILYDNENRAYAVKDGKGNFLVYINYGDGGSSFGSGRGFTFNEDLSATRLITASGVVMTYTYDARGTLVDITQACTDNLAGCQASSGSGYDYNFKHDEVVDENGNTSNLNWSNSGSNLEGGTDALGHSISLTYDNLNNLTQVVNTRGYTTTYAYDDSNFPSFRTRMTDTLGHVTIYTATISATDGISGLIKAEKDPNGVVTAYDYDEFGQITRTVRAFGTADAVTTTYGYDEIGRLITTTQTSALESHTSLNVYDDADQLLATIANWTGTDPANWQTDCANGTNETNICTRYKYDEAGRTISTTNALSQTNLTFYDEAGRVVTSVVNYDGATAFSQLCTDFTNPDPEYNICSLTGYDEFGRVVTRTNSLGHQSVTEYNVLGRVSRSIQNYDDGVFDANDPDTDIQTVYKYDDAGNTIVVTDTLTRTTRTFYDALNRVVGTVANWRGEMSSTITTTASLQNCLTLPENRDYDICTLYKYDEMGNTIIVTDTLGRMTRTFYDELGRVFASVQNWNPDTLTSPTNCNLSPGNTDPDNICTLYGYDKAGNQITTTNALSQTRLTVYDEANRAVIQVTNWNMTTTITADGTGCADTAANPVADENLCTSITGYDQLGRRSAVTDTLGLLTTFEYDGLGRVVTATRFLGSQPVTSTTSYDALGNRLSQTNAHGYTTTYQYDSLNRVIVTTSPEGVAITQTYNAAGWVITTTDSLGHSTVNEYDDLGRVITTTDALGNQTQYEYDALGNQVAMIDAEGVKTTYVYDGLNRLVQVIENDVASPGNENEEDVTTEYVYDALGNQVLVINAREISFTQTLYDGLNRPVVITDAVGNETQHLYNALGSRVVMTDGNGAVTQYTYDDLNRLIVAAYLSDTETVSYSYDAAGNRLVMTDTLGVTSYKYDEFYRLISVTNPFSGTVLYGYDLVGNRTHLTYPDSKVVTYTYDGDNRLVAVEDWDTGLTTYDYDPAGRLVTTTLPNGVETIFGYDDANRLTSIIHRDNLDVLLARYLYQLDKVGNRIVVTETLATPGGEGLAALPGVQDNLLAGHEGPVTADVVLATVTGGGTADVSRPAAQAKPTTNIAHIPYPWSMNAAELALVPPEQAGAVTDLTMRLARTTLTADGRDGTHILVLVTDEQGRPVADGTRVFFQATGGQVRPAQATTTNGLVFAWLAAGRQVEPGQVTAYNGSLTATVDFTLVAPAPGSLRLGEAADGGALPFDLAELVEYAQNTIETPVGEPPYIVRPNHQAEFGSGRLDFTVRGETPVTLTVELASVVIGQEVLFDGPAGATPAVYGNVVTYERGPNLVEEFVARDSGIEQRWRIEQPPQAGGDLVIAVQLQTNLILAPAPGGQGFIFRNIDPITRAMSEVAHYGRAVAIDANGDTIPADLSFETLVSQPTPSLFPTTSYLILMTFPAEWLAEAAFPLLVDPLIGSAVQLDEGGVEADQSQPAVAYNSTDDEFLVVWQDDRNGDDDIFAQRVDGDGNLTGDNITVNAAAGDQTLPDVAYNPDQNSYLVVWRDGTEAVKGQVVEHDGDLQGTVKSLAGSADTRNYPVVTYSSSDDAWLVAWQEWDGGSSSYRLQARAVKGSSGALQTTFTVYNNGSDSVTPDISANSSGGFLVAWEQTVGGDTDIYARRVISSAVDGGTIVLTSTTDAQVAPAVVYNPDDDEYLVAWQDLAGANDSIWARQVTGVTATNPFVGNAFQVNPGTYNALAPAVTYFSPGVAISGAYLIAWELPISGETGRITAQRVLTDGAKSGSVLNLASSSPNESANVALGYGPAITATVAAWTSESGGHSDVAAIWIPVEGSAGDEFFVHPQPDDQERPEVAYNSDDEEYLVVWHDYRAGEANPNLFGQRVSITGTLLGDNITITSAAYRQLYPKVVYGDGVYLVAWTHYPGLSDSDFDAYAGIISAAGTVITNSLVISTGTAPNSQAQPTDIIYNGASQKFLVLYQDRTVVQFNIWGRHVDSAAALGSPIQITSQDNRAEIDAVGAYNPDNDHYLVVWEQSSDLYGRRLTGAGVVSTTETITVADSGVSEEKPDVVYLNDQTGYVVVWRVSSGGSREVYGRVVASNGTTPAAAYQISSGAHADKLSRIALDGEGGALVIWHYRVDSETNDLYGRRLGSDGQPLDDGLSAPFTILEMADTRQMYPVLAGNGDGQYLLAWQDDRNGNWDIYGQPFQHLTADFSASPTTGPAPLNVSFTDTSQPSGAADEWAWDFGDSGTSASQNPNHTYTSAGLYTVTLTITDTDTGETDTVIKTNYISAVTTGTTSLITTTMVYTYDNLYRLTDAVYSGGITATYEYHYDATGNRTAYTTTITSTEVITYLYDNANRLVESVVIGGDTTTYTWDNVSRLITTTVAGQVSRVYQYSQDGDLITATVDSLETTFAYDGDGRRLLMSVAGEVTTYTLDYALSSFRILFEDGPDDDKHYLYGVQCIVEVVAEGTVEEERRYYQRDGNNMVRQTTNETADVTLAWTYTPEGMVLVGEEGPVTYLDCGTGGIYDWSTGLIFKNGRFFDSSTGIWITLSGVVVYYRIGPARGRKRKNRGDKNNKRFLLILLLVLVAVALASCDSPEPECPNPTPETLPLDGYAVFSDTIPNQQSKEWKPDEKDTVKTDLNNAVNIIAGTNGFGSRDNLFLEIGIDKANPIFLLRQDIGSRPDSRLRANNPLMFVYDAYFENPDSLGPGLFAHELAHFWDQNKNYELSMDMADWVNWGEPATNYSPTDQEIFAEAFRIYFWQDYDQGYQWTDDFGAGTGYGAIEPDSLYLDPNDPSKPPTTTITELRVQDKYDWFQREFTGAESW